MRKATKARPMAMYSKFLPMGLDAESFDMRGPWPKAPGLLHMYLYSFFTYGPWPSHCIVYSRYIESAM